MISTFNLTKLENLLKDFYTITGIRIVVFNESFEELASYPQEMADHCRLIRHDPVANQNCISCDCSSCLRAQKQKEPYIYQCHAGFTEAVSPIILSNVVIGYLVFGQVLCHESSYSGLQIIQDCCRNYRIDHQALSLLCQKLPLISKEYILAASHLLQAVASYLCLERLAVLKQQGLPVRIDRYIMDNLSEDIGIPQICEHFGIKKTKLCEIAKQCYGKGIATHIRLMRIHYARKLLTESPDMTVTEIAHACGFHDYNHFIATFKTVVGLPPRQYRVQTGLGEPNTS